MQNIKLTCDRGLVCSNTFIYFTGNACPLTLTMSSKTCFFPRENFLSQPNLPILYPLSGTDSRTTTTYFFFRYKMKIQFYLPLLQFIFLSNIVLSLPFNTFLRRYLHSFSFRFSFSILYIFATE
jgi:hypothetical protein